MITAAVVILLAAAAFLGIYLKVKKEVEAVAETVFCENIYIEDVNVSGMSDIEAKKLFDEKTAVLGEETFSLKHGDKEISFQLKDLGLYSSNLDEVIQEAVSYGKSGSIWERYNEMKKLKEDSLHFDIVYAMEEGQVQKVVESVVPEMETEAQDATIAREDGKFVVTEEVNGIQIQVQESVQKIMDYFGETWEFSGKETLELVSSEKIPEITSEMLSKVKDEMGSFRTTYTPGNNRAKNIALATSRIDGTLLMPGEEFSTSDTMGSRNAANGYLTAGAYLNGEVIDSYGGGVCQVSTTLYNAVLESELEVTMRYEHSMLVDYVAPARDAAIAEGSKDFKFKNNTDAPIYISGYTSGGSVTFVIYGEEYRSEDRTVEYQSRTLSTTEKKAKFEASNAALGTISKTTSGHTGKKAELWKVVYENGEEVSRDHVNSSSYMMSPDYYSVGTASDNAEASAIVKNAISSQDRGTIEAAIAKAKALIAAEEALEEEAEAPEKQPEEQPEEKPVTE